ncbi:MAG: tandem-95 repeat protein, partial [Sphingomonas sp.]
NNHLVFTPGTAFDHLAAGATEVVTLTYAMKDDQGATSNSTVTVTITGTNDGPVAVSDVAVTTENASITVDVLANDTDLDDGHVFTLTAAAAPSGKGVASVVNNQLVFTPGTNFDHLAVGATEVVTVSYAMMDDQGAVSNSTLTITITGTNDAPVAVADVAAAIEDGAIVTGSVATNDSDADDNATHSFTLDAPVAGLTLNADGSYSFDPSSAAYQALAAGELLAVVAHYTITDDQGATAQAMLTIALTGTNDAPVVTSATSDAAGAVREAGTNDAGTPSVAGQLASSDVDHEATAAWSGSANGTYGSFAINAAGAWGYTLDNARASTDALAAGETVTETFLATVTDDQGATATQLVTITVTGTNDAPIAVADVAAGTENQVLT